LTFDLGNLLYRFYRICYLNLIFIRIYTLRSDFDLDLGNHEIERGLTISCLMPSASMLRVVPKIFLVSELVAGRSIACTTVLLLFLLRTV
jgi:uncharacterized membrane protein YfhO